MIIKNSLSICWQTISMPEMFWQKSRNKHMKNEAEESREALDS